MRTTALSRKLVATAALGLVFGGASIAAAAVAPSSGSSHNLAVDESTTVAPDGSTTTVAPDDSTTTVAPDDSTTSTTVDESTTTTIDESTTTTVDESTTTTTAPPTTPCNHGADVSDVAHSAPRGHDAGPGAHGKAVSAIARAKCADHHEDEGGAAGGDASANDTPGGKSNGKRVHHGKTGAGSDD